MGDCFKTYNKTLKELIDIIADELPQDSIMDSIKRKYTAAVTTDRTILLTETGKEIFQFRDYISEGRWDELINKQWETDSQANAVAHAEGFDTNALQHIITTLRTIWNGYSDAEKKKIQKLIKKLLSEYSKYLLTKQ